MDTRTLVWQKKDQFMMWGNKKERRKKHAVRNNNATKKTQKLKRNKTQKMPTAVLRGDSQSGSAANAPIRSALSWPFYLSWSEFVLAGAWPRSFAPRLYSQAPAKVPFEVFIFNFKNKIFKNMNTTSWFFSVKMVYCT